MSIINVMRCDCCLTITETAKAADWKPINIRIGTAATNIVNGTSSNSRHSDAEVAVPNEGELLTAFKRYEHTCPCCIELIKHSLIGIEAKRRDQVAAVAKIKPEKA